MENLQKLLPEDSRITEYSMLGGTDGVARVCRIVVESRPTASSLLRTAIWLPDDWNGIFVGLGNGGIGGNIGGPTLILDYAKKSFACATTDMGTSKIRSGERKTADAELWKDYTWRSGHVMTVIAKLLIEGYYGRKAEYSYFFGASAGGLQAFSEAQRFPEDYDGIIAGVPSNNALNLVAHFLWMHINLRNPDGTSKFAPGDAEELSRYAAEFFQSRGDGEPGDDFVTYSYTDENTVADFLEFLHQKAPRFTPKQLQALEAVYHGPVHKKTGEQIYCGLPIGAERNCEYFSDGTNGSKFGFPWFRLFFGEDFDDWNFDYADDFEKMLSAIGKDFGANNPDLRPLAANGTKFLVYSGCSDPLGPWADAVKYFNRVFRCCGGAENVSEFLRFYILPGKAHSDGGLGVNCTWGDEARTSLLDTLRNWRENGNAPDDLVGAHIDKADGEETIKFIRKIAPYLGGKQEITQFPQTTSDRILDAMQ